MLKLVRYIRPYAGVMVIIFLLLFAQAMIDLSLPEYMSRIVNVGIQQNGIEEPLPTVLRRTSLDRIKLLLPPSAAESLETTYRTLDRPSLSPDAYAEWQSRYPLLSSEALAVLDDKARLDEELRAELTRALAVLAMLTQDGFALPELPTGTDPFVVLASLPPEQRVLLTNKLEERLQAVPDLMLNQSAIAWIGAEYEQVGLDQAAIQSRFILNTGGLMLVIALLGAACAVAVGYFASRTAAGISRDLRLATFSRVEQFASAEFDTFSTASLITRTTNDVQQIQMALVMLMRILFFAPILGTGGIIKVVNANIAMGWIIALAVAVLMTLIIVLFQVAVPRFKKIQKLVDRLNLVTREILSGLMVIRAFNTERHEEERFDTANQDLTRINLFVSRLMALMWPLMMLIMNMVSLLIVWVGAKQVDLGAMQVGDIMAFIQYTMQIIMSFLMLSMIFIMLPRASVSAQRIAEVLAVEPSIVDPAKTSDFDPARRGLVVFDHVSFRYPNAQEDVLHDISLTARPGETTAIIGSTGCGKSTLVNLIPRFYDVTAGRVLVDGADIRQVPQAGLRQKIGYIAQRGILFTGSIRENIAYGKPDADEPEIRQAAATAQALDFIDASEEGLETAIAQGGANVSGGQKQRLSIARALVRQPDIYIFDDAFSALDYKTDAALRRALRQQTRQATIIIVAQRIGTIRHAENIIVLDQGRIVGQGRHEDLLKTCPVYMEIAASQLTEKELAV